MRGVHYGRLGALALMGLALMGAIGGSGVRAAVPVGLLAYAATDGNIWRSGADGTGRQVLTNDGTADNPLWGPNGYQIIFSSRRDGRSAEVGGQQISLNQLYIMDADGRNQKLLSDGTGDDRFADLLPGTGRIVFLRSRNYRLVNGAPVYDVQVLTMRLDGSDVQGWGTLPGTPQVRFDAYAPRVSPDGKTLVLIRQQVGGSTALVLMDLPGGGTTQISPEMDGGQPGVQYLWPRWTPEGRLVVLRRVYPNDNKLVSFDRAGKGTQILLKDLTFEALSAGFDVDWTRRILFAARSPDLPGGQRPEEIYLIDLATGEFGVPLDSGHAPAWTPPPPPTPIPSPSSTATSTALPTAQATQVAATATPRPGTGQPTPLISTADPLFYRVWERVDRPVLENRASRSWTWGPQPRTSGNQEPYAGQPGNTRLVQYFDKARMELNPAQGSNPAFVTNGLLVVEMLSGRIQVGANQYETRDPATTQIGGDGADNPAPSYALLGKVSSLSGENTAASRIGQIVSATLSATGTVGTVAKPPATVRLTTYVNETKHNVPDVFWSFLNQRGNIYDGGYREDTLYDWVFTMGYPISEPYWTKQRVGDKVLDVLVQVYQRQVLTYTPTNAPAWQVQLGNVAQHYYVWRYGQNP